MIRYHVIITTGKEEGSETDANVYVNIAGDRGDTGRRYLVQSNNIHPFRCGQVSKLLHQTQTN